MDCCDFNSLYYAVNAMCQKLNEVIKRVNEIDPGTSELDGIRQQIEQIETDVQSNSIALLEKYSPKNPPPYPVTSVNGKTGALVIDYQELVKNNGVQVKLMTPAEYNAASAQTWTAYYDLGFRIVGVKSSTENKIEAFYLLKQDVNDHTPIPVTVQGSGGEVDPNLILQVQKNTEAIGAINDEMPRKYSPTNVPPYPVTSVNDESGTVKVKSLYGATSGTVSATAYNGDVYSKLRCYNAGGEIIGDIQLKPNSIKPFPDAEILSAGGSKNSTLIRKDWLYFNEIRIKYSAVSDEVLNINYKFGDCVILSEEGTLPEGNESGIMVTFTESNIPSTAHLVRSAYAGLLVGLAYHDPIEGKSTIRIQMKSISGTNPLTDAIFLYNMYGDITIYKVFNYVT